jgi:hypothetical protein
VERLGFGSHQLRFAYSDRQNQSLKVRSASTSRYEPFFILSIIRRTTLFMSKPIVHYVDALVGARKTSRTIEFIASSPASEKFLIATPNTKLSRETAAKLAKAGVSVLQIDSEDGTNCKQALIDAICANQYQVIIVNLNVILQLDRIYTANLHLFIDEIPNIYKSYPVDGIVISKNDIRRYFSTRPTKENVDFLDVYITAEGIDFLSKWRSEMVFNLETTTDKKGKENPSLPNVLETMWCEHYRMVLDTESHNKFTDGDGIRLTFHSLLEASVFVGFKSVTILGANFKDSLLYLVHEKNIRFVPHDTIKGFYDDHSHKAANTKVLYFSHRNCSKHLLGEIGFQTFFDKAAEMIGKMFPGKRHIFTMNHPDLVKTNGKWVRPAAFRWALDAGMMVSPDPRGWNGLADYDMAIHMAALNYTNMDFHFFDSFLTISREEAVRSMTFERIYQFLGRTSLRSYDRVYKADEELILIVFDRQTAMRMQKIIGCGEPTFIDLGIAKLQEDKKPAYDKTAAKTGSQARYRENKAMEERVAADEATPQYEGFGSRIWATSDDKEPTLRTYQIEDLINLLERTSEIPQQFKGNCSQFREGSFGDLTNPAIAGNLLTSKMLAFDIDDASRSPQEVSDYLGSLGMTNIIYNSFSNKGYPYRFHILIPMTRAVNEENYRHIFNVVRALLEARFGENEVPIEAKYGSINKWILMPCASKFDCGFLIVKRCWKSIITKQHGFLDVAEYLVHRTGKKSTTEADVVAVPVKETVLFDAADADAIVDQFLALAVPGNRDTAFGQAGYALINTHNAPIDIALPALQRKQKPFGKDAGAAKRLVKSLTANRPAAMIR